MEKIVRDGMVAVAVSRDFGAGCGTGGRTGFLSKKL